MVILVILVMIYLCLICLEDNKMSFYNYDETGEIIQPKKVQIDCQAAINNGERVLVEQSHKDNVDINNIVKRYAGNAELIAKVSSLSNFVYDDVTTNNFEEMMKQMIKARDTFSQVPSDIRKQFGNDPAAFMDFVYNPDNKDKLVEMGLANPPPSEPKPIEVVVTNPVETPPQESGAT